MAETKTGSSRTSRPARRVKLESNESFATENTQMAPNPYRRQNDTLLVVAVIGLIIGSFFLGNFYGELRTLKSGRVVGSAQPETSVATMTMSDVAEVAGLNTRTFDQCMSDQTFAQAVDDDLTLAQSVGANGTPTFFINGRMIVGAQPYTVFEEAIEAALNGNLDQVLGAGSGVEDGAPEAVAPLTDAQWQQLLSNPAAVTGNENASVVIVEFTDFQCPFCQRYYSETHSLIKANYVETGKVKYLVRDLPLPFHGQAATAAQAARCAGAQNMYWEMYNALFENQTAWGA